MSIKCFSCSSRGLWRLLVGELVPLAARIVSLAWLVKTKVGQTNLGVWILLLQSHHLLLNLKLELIMDRNRGLSSGFNLGLFNLTERFKVTNSAHDLLGKCINVLRLLCHVNVERLGEHLFEGDSLLEQKIEVCNLDLKIIASLSLFSDGARFVSRQLVEQSLHQTRQDVFLN